MTPQANNDRQRLLGVLEDVWTRNAQVQRFALSFNPALIQHVHGGWTIPVASGLAGGSGHELNRALGELQEQVEERSHMPVYISLQLNPN